jgi:hypothetical protein
MLVLGLLLLVGAGVVGVTVVIDNADPVTVSAFGQSYATSTAGVFLAGVIAGLAVMAGVGLMMAGFGRSRAKGKRFKMRVHQVRAEKNELAEENARLRARIEDDTVVDGGDPYPTEESTVRGKHSV